MGKKSGPCPCDRAKGGVKRSPLTEASGIVVGMVVEGAHCHDMKLTRATLESVPPIIGAKRDEFLFGPVQVEGVDLEAELARVQDPEWERTAVLRSLDDIRPLKSETGGDIVTTGSISLVRTLLSAGLVDEYRLFTYPVVLGRGQRLFADATDVPRLRLVESQAFRSGIVLLRYRTA